MQQITVKDIIRAIEEYYGGKKLEQICEEYEIEHVVFENWLLEYKQITVEIMDLRLENERLRKLFVDTVLINQTLSKRLEKYKKGKTKEVRELK